MNSQTITYLNENIIITRSGYTGEDGFEISIPNNIVNIFLNKLLELKKLILCGLGSRDSLRLEAGLSLYGNDLDENTSPIEANLSWAIDKDRLTNNSLNGSQILSNQLKFGTKKYKVGLRINSKSILRQNMNIYDSKHNQVGTITSGGFSPILKTSIGIGFLNSSIKKNHKIYCSIRDKIEELIVQELPFVNHNYKRRAM